jgi:hypothetical protein
MQNPPKPKKPKQPGNTDVSTSERELEDRVGRRENQGPDLVPPGTVSRDEGLGKASETGGSELQDDEALAAEALAADRANARVSDRNDARDGVDNSDTVAIDPDAAGGKGPR